MRPSRQSINLLKAALRNPRFGEYTLYFSNVVNESDLQELADADEGELVTGVHEFFADFNPLDELHFAVTTSSLSGGGTAALLAPSQWDPNASQLCVERATSGLCAALLALKRRPVVRYASQSETARRVASGVARAIESDPVLYDFRAPAGSGAPVLLVLDRRDDPVTPLLSQWTYQAMLHEGAGLRLAVGAAEGFFCTMIRQSEHCSEQCRPTRHARIPQIPRPLPHQRRRAARTKQSQR